MNINLSYEGRRIQGTIELTPEEERRFALYLLAGSISQRPTLTPAESISRASLIIEKIGG